MEKLIVSIPDSKGIHKDIDLSFCRIQIGNYGNISLSDLAVRIMKVITESENKKSQKK